MTGGCVAILGRKPKSSSGGAKAFTDGQRRGAYRLLRSSARTSVGAEERSLDHSFRAPGRALTTAGRVFTPPRGSDIQFHDHTPCKASGRRKTRKLLSVFVKRWKRDYRKVARGRNGWGGASSHTRNPRNGPARRCYTTRSKVEGQAAWWRYRIV